MLHILEAIYRQELHGFEPEEERLIGKRINNDLVVVSRSFRVQDFPARLVELTVCMHVRMHVCMHVCRHVRMHACMCMCAYVCVYVYFTCVYAYSYFLQLLCAGFRGWML
jgi:hypothetical protein